MAAIISGLPNLGYSGLAPDADVTVVALAPGQDDLIRNEALVAAIDGAMRDGYDVISISLGVQTPDPTLRDSIASATASGVVVVAAAGPDPSDIVLYPAAFPGVLAAAGDAAAGGHAHHDDGDDPEGTGGHESHDQEGSSADTNGQPATASSRFPTVIVPLSAIQMPRYEPADRSFSLEEEDHSSAAAAMLAALVAGYRSAAERCRDIADLTTYLSRVLDNGSDGRAILDEVLPECTGQEN
jgi:hypothetical protein